jgi:hypothetical protein
LLLKAIGVWLFASGAATAVGYIGFVFQSLTVRTSASYMAWMYTLVTPVAQLGIGLYLFFGGRWIADLAIPSNRPYCHECGYDLTSATGTVCNECGTPFRAQAPDNSPIDE